MVPLAMLLGILAALASAAGFFKAWHQEMHDKQRKTYRLVFPQDLEINQVLAWLRAISGTLRGGFFSRYKGTPSIAFEVHATPTGIAHFIRVPWTYDDYIIRQLRGIVPGVHVMPEDRPEPKQWTQAVEVGITHRSRPLDIKSAEDVADTILAALYPIDTGQELLMQWVVTPMMPSQRPVHNMTRSDHLNTAILLGGIPLATRDEINERRQKLEEPNYLAVLRVAAIADTPKNANHLLYRVRAALAATRGPSNRFFKRFVSQKRLHARIHAAAASVVYPIQLSAAELAALIGWDISGRAKVGLPPSASRQLFANVIVPTTGRELGVSNTPGRERKIAMSYSHAVMHTHVFGPTGSGKTTLLANMARQDIQQGHGLVLIENKGDLFRSVLDYVPRSRIKDVVIMDVLGDAKFPIGFNILNQGDPRVVVDDLTTLFDQLYKGSAGVWTRVMLYHGLQTIIQDPNLTFIDLAPLLVPMNTDEAHWRDDVISRISDRYLRDFWLRHLSQPRSAQDRITQPVMDRIWQLTSRAEVRNIIGQSSSSFQMADVIRDNKILLINLEGLPPATANLLATLIINALWQGAKMRYATRPFFLYLDEFQDVLTLPIALGDMMVKSRGYNLGMVVANQHLGQLTTEIRQAIMANARTKVVFQTSIDDAAEMAKEFGALVAPDDFTHLRAYEAIARIATDHGISPPVTLKTMPPAPSYSYAVAIRSMSRNLYGRAAFEVEKAIWDRRSLGPTKPRGKRPKISGEGWG